MSMELYRLIPVHIFVTYRPPIVHIAVKTCRHGNSIGLQDLWCRCKKSGLAELA